MEYKNLTKTYKTADELLRDLKGIEPDIRERLGKDLNYWASYRLKGGKAEVKNRFQVESDEEGSEINVIMGREIILNGKPIKEQTKTLKITRYPDGWIYSVW